MVGGIDVFLAFCLGAALGSFANAAAMRTAAEKRWWGRERSVCDSCGRVLSSCDLIPVISFVILQGRCRSCRAPIPPRHFAAELAGGALAALFAWRFGLTPALAFATLSLPFIIFHTLTDLETGYIYDSWAIAMAVCGMSARAAGGWGGLLDGLFGALSGFGTIGAIIVASRGRMGLGDAMLMLGIGAFMGFKLTLLSLYFGFMSGGLVVIPLLLTRRVTRKTAVPLGPFLCAGMALAMFCGERVLRYLGYLAQWPWTMI